MKKLLLCALTAGLFLGCAHAPDGTSCKDKCEYDFPGCGWRWAFIFPVFPTPEYAVCMDACKQGKTYRRFEPQPPEASP